MNDAIRRALAGHQSPMRMLRLPGVYGPQRDSELLAAAIAENVVPGERVLDLFTGSGIQAVTAAKTGAAEVTAVDVSRRAAASVQLNALLNGVRVQGRVGNLFEPVAGQSFDVIVANPPYVPFEKDEGATGPARAWEAGHDGRRFLDPLLEQAPRHLRPGGRILIVHSSLCDELQTLAALQAGGLDATVVRSETAPLGPITAPWAESLERRGLLQPGERTEATVVVRGIKALGVADPRRTPFPAMSSA